MCVYRYMPSFDHGTYVGFLLEKLVHENLSSSEASTVGSSSPWKRWDAARPRKWRNPPTASWRGNMATDWWVGSSATCGICVYIYN